MQRAHGGLVSVYVVGGDRGDVVVLDLIAGAAQPSEGAERVAGRRFGELRGDGFLDCVVPSAAGRSQPLRLEYDDQGLAGRVVQERVRPVGVGGREGECAGQVLGGGGKRGLRGLGRGRDLLQVPSG